MLDPKCIYRKSIFAKCTRLACLLSFASLFLCFLAVQNSSIGDLVTDSLTHSVIEQQISLLYFFHICNFDICNEIQQAVATPYRPGKIFEPPFRLDMTNLSQIFLQNNLALYILSNKNFFLPSLVTYRAVRDLISETKKFANCEDLRFANSEDFTFLMPCCIGCSEINKINRHLICSLLPLTSPHLQKKRPLTKTAVTL